MKSIGVIRSTAIAAALLMVLSISLTAEGPPTLAGTLITNQAKAEYKNLGGEDYEVTSNVVVTAVSLVPGVDITDGAHAESAPGTVVVFSHILTNTSNAPAAININVLNAAGFPYSIFHDTDLDMNLTAADAPFDDTDGDGLPDTGTMDPSSSLPMFIRISIPNGTDLSIEAMFGITASSSLDSSTADYAEDSISVNEARPYIDVYDSPSYAYLGTEYEFVVSYGNTGDITFTAASLAVPIPSALDFVSADGSYSYDPMTRRITWNLGDLAAGSSGNFTVRVRVQSAGAGITFVNNEASITGGAGVVLTDYEQTGLVTTAPVSIVLVADPDTIIGDGVAKSLLTATVLDVLGNPVPDGTPVTFTTELGTFLPNGLATYIGTTTGGVATVLLVAPLIHGFEPVANPVEASAGTPETGLAFDTITITFSPAGILGIVWSAVTAGPVEGILAELLDGDGDVIYSVRTGADGRYMLIAPSIGMYTVRVHTNETDGRSIVEMHVDVQLLQGAIWSTPGAILGTVYVDIAEPVSASSVLPFADARISLFKDGLLIAQTTSDEFGEFVFEDLELGDYVLMAETDAGLIGYSGASLLFNGEVLISKFVYMAESGKVYDAGNLAAVPNAEVTLLHADGPLAGTPVLLPATPSLLEQDNPTYSDALGYYIFFAEPGLYILRATAFGYLGYESEPFEHEGLAVNNWIPMVLETSESLEIVKVSSRAAAAPGETVKFTVTWSNTSGSPLPGVKLVDLLPEEVSVIEDSISGNGIYDPLTHSITWTYGNINGSSDPWTEDYYATVDEEIGDGTEILNRAKVSSSDGSVASASVSALIASKPGIEIMKSAGSASANTGDMVTYKVSVLNSEDVPNPMAAYDVEVEDELPAGFSYIVGSTYIDGASAPDPSVSGTSLTWQLGDMLVGEGHEIIYKAGIKPGAAIGSDSINYAYAYGTGELGYPFEVGPASASVLVIGPAFSSQGAIIGKVFEDKDGDTYQDAGEEGIKGAELLMDDGMRIVTGEGGLFHIGQLKPGVRSIKLNLASLPFSAELTNSFKDATGISSSFFVNVYPSGTARADFAVRRTDEGGQKQLGMMTASDELVKLIGGAAEFSVKVSIKNTGDSPVTGAKLSAGAASSDEGAKVLLIGGNTADIPDLEPGESREMTIRARVDGVTDEYSSILIGLAAYIPGEGSDSSRILARGSTAVITHSNELIRPAEGYAITAPGAVSLARLGHIGIKTVSPLSSGTKLLVNGFEVSKDKVGTTTRDGKQGKLFLEYVSVQLSTGENFIELTDDRSGRLMAEAIALLAGPAEKTVIVHVPSGEGLNVGSQIAVAALAVDGMGIPAGRYVMPSFRAENSDFVGADVKPQDEGFQAIGGELGNYDLLLAVTNPEGGISLTGKIGEHMAEADFSALKPKSAPALITGTIEVTHFITDFSSSYIRARAFMRKEFSGGVLTLRYDSEQGAADGLYSDASGDTMYSLYGDKSTLDNASPSASPFYAKFAASGFYAMWGDFQPAYQGAELSSFKSKFTGFSAGASFKGFTLGAFVAPVRDGIRSERFEADGTSGYFFLDEFPILAGSESIYIILADKDDVSVVLERISLKRALDYYINYADGSLLLNQPVPSVDASGNKYFIEAVYTTPGTEITGLAAGGRVHQDFGTADAGLSASLITDYSSVDAVIGADFGLDLGEYFRFRSEAAVSFTDGAYSGYAVKAGAASKVGKVGLNLDMTATDGGFVKPGEVAPMPRQIALVGKVAVGEDTPIILSLTSGNYWKGAAYDFSSENKLVVGYRLPFNFNLALGLITTFAYDGASDAKGAIFDAFAEAAPIPQLKIAAYAQIAKVGEINDRDGDYSLSITYKPVTKVGITLQYVTGMGVSDRYHTLSLGADVAVTKEGKVFGKLSAPFAAGSAKVLSLGYSDAYTLLEGLRANFLLEGALGFTGAGIDAETTRVSASGSLKYTASNGFTASLKQEVQYGMTDGVKTLTMLSLSGKPVEWLSLEGIAAAYYGNSPNREGLPLNAEASFSAAFRPSNTIYTGLLKAETKYYQGDNLEVQEAAVITIAVTDWTLEAGKYLSLSAKAGYKLSAEGPLGEALSLNSILLAQGGASLHITDSTDIEAFVRGIGWAEDWKLGYSVQIVQRIFNLVSVAAGYNSSDLSDTDITDQKPWTEGFYLKLMIKF